MQRKDTEMKTLAGTGGRARLAIWSGLMLGQLLLLSMTRLLIARARRTDPRDDAGLTTAEYVIMLVVAIPIVVAIALLLYNHFKSDAQTVVNQK
jgi:hypothetical protein